MPSCADCLYWATSTPETTWAAPCDLGIIAKPEAWQSCSHFTDRERAAAERVMQSEARGPVPGGVFQMWQRAMRGKP
jgi:hypothetical protein